MTYRPELDGLRAIAVGLVLIFHFNLVPFVTGGFIGVDVFFVLSGYLITSIVVQRIEGGTFSLGDFYVRRIRRLMPALYATCAIVLLFGLVFLFPRQLDELARQTAAAAFQVSNVYYWQTLNYFVPGAGQTLLLHTWSLGVEAQFYLFYPIFLLIVSKLLPGSIRTWLWLLLAGSLLLNVVLVFVKPTATFYLLPTRAWELAAGGFIALLPQRKAKGEWLAWAGLALILVGALVIDKSRLFPGGWALLPVVGSLLVIRGATGGPVTSVLASEPFRWTGQVSYSLYLVHWPIAVAANMLIPGGPNFVVRIALTGLSVAAAALLYRFVETPFRKPRGITRRLTMGQGYGLLTAGIGAACAVVVVAAGFPQRYSPAVLTYLEGEEDRFVAQRACTGELREAPPCLLGEEGAPVTTILWGDSHALASFGLFDTLLEVEGEAGVLAFYHSCPPVLGFDEGRRPGACTSFKERIRGSLQIHPTAQRVVLASIWRLSERDLFDPAGRKLREAERYDLLRQTIAELQAQGLEVAVMLPVPVHPQSVPQALARGAANPEPGAFAIDADDYQEVNGKLIAALRSIEGVELIEPAKILCTPECRVSVDGRSLYADNNHLSRFGSVYLGRQIVEQRLGGSSETASSLRD